MVAIPITINGTIATSSDADYFRVTLGAGKKLTATLTPNATSDYDLFVYNSNGTLIGSSELGTGAVDTVSVTNTGTGAITRYVRVDDVYLVLFYEIRDTFCAENTKRIPDRYMQDAVRRKIVHSALPFIRWPQR